MDIIGIVFRQMAARMGMKNVLLKAHMTDVAVTSDAIETGYLEAHRKEVGMANDGNRLMHL